MRMNAVKTSDGRFQKTELKIQQAVEKLNLVIAPSNQLRIQDFCERAGVSRASFYRHYETIDEAVAAYQERVRKDFEEFCIMYINPKRPLEVNFYLVFCYFRRHQEFYRKLFDHQRFDSVRPMMAKVRELCVKKWIEEYPRLPESCQDQLFFLTWFEFLKEVAYWFRFEGCEAGMEAYHIERLVHLVKYLPRRWYPQAGRETVEVA